MPERAAATVRVRVDPNGPTYIDGPVEVTVDGGEAVFVDRFRVAICACRRSARYPLCDGSHEAIHREPMEGEEK